MSNVLNIIWGNSRGLFWNYIDSLAWEDWKKSQRPHSGYLIPKMGF